MLTQAIMGLAPVVSGVRLWRQRSYLGGGCDPFEIVKEGIAFVPQGRRVFTHLGPCLHLDERMEMRVPAHKKRPVVEKHASAGLCDGAVPGALTRSVRDMGSQMSGGHSTQMLALGPGLMANPVTALLLDEPTLGLAPIIVKEVFTKVSWRSASCSGTTIMVVEHNIKGVLEIADRGYVDWTRGVEFEGTPQTYQATTDRVFLGTEGEDEERLIL